VGASVPKTGTTRQGRSPTPSARLTVHRESIDSLVCLRRRVRQIRHPKSIALSLCPLPPASFRPLSSVALPAASCLLPASLSSPLSPRHSIFEIRHSKFRSACCPLPPASFPLPSACLASPTFPLHFLREAALFGTDRPQLSDTLGWPRGLKIGRAQVCPFSGPRSQAPVLNGGKP
jgi:hypothetical protein